MSKASRRQQRLAKTDTGTPGTPDATGGASSPSARTTVSTPSTRPSTSPVGTPRVGRTRRPTYAQRSFTERYRTLIIAAVAFAAVGLIGAFVFAGASRAAYVCTSEFAPAATPVPAASASLQPGYVQDDLGANHVGVGTQVRYTFCPPASGDHYAGSGIGPIAARFYGVDDKTIPQGWIHNLEHGGLVLLYRGDSPGATVDGQKALRAFYDSFPASPVCGFEAGTNVSPVIARFEDMATPFAALLWDRVLPLDSFDSAAILQFYSAFAEKTNPEKGCASPTPIPTASPSGSGSAVPSASPSGSGSAVPSASASASASAVPSASGSASASPS